MAKNPELWDALRARIQAMERIGPGRAETVTVAAGIDEALPWGGLPLACLHEVVAEDHAATGFCALLLARLAGRGPVLWCLRRGGAADCLYGPGLAAFGLTPDRLILARGACEREVLWAMEEGLRCARLGGVLAETQGLEPTTGRRLQLAAEAGGVTGIVLHGAGQPSAGIATTRWRVRAAPSAATAWGGLGAARWRVDLERCRNGGPRSWLMEWRDETRDFLVVSELSDRPPDPPEPPRPLA